MRSLFAVVILSLSASAAHSATPYNLNVSLIRSCKIKYDLANSDRLITLIQGLDENNKVIVEFGNSKGQPLEAQESQAAKSYLLAQGICPEIKLY